MSYCAAIDQLNAMVPELFGQPGQARRKFSLSEIRVLLNALGDPHMRFPSVLIAGTNGKGSTAATLASILSESGVRAGLYTSPHLERVNERIRVGREEIGNDDFAAQYFRVHDAAQRLVLDGGLAHLPSYFEMLTAVAFQYFAEAGVEVAVLEVGMGGRLDATNIVDPLVSVITDISLDHTEWLGSTIAAITREKAGILRPGGKLISLPQDAEVNRVLAEVCTGLGVKRVNAEGFLPPVAAGDDSVYPIEALGSTIEVDSPLKGAHQHRNLALAVAAAVELARGHGFPVTAGAIAEGIRRTRWPGRLERMEREGVEWVLDVAHNPAGAWALRAGLNGGLRWERPRTLVFSCLRDKPVEEMARILFPLFDEVIVAPIRTGRGAALDDLLAAAGGTGTTTKMAESVREALEMARARSQGGVAVVSGSVYLVGEARTLLLDGRGEEG